MKRLFLALTGWLFCLMLQAQSPQYQFQYWFDDDYSSHITESNSSGIWQKQMETSHLSIGFHILFFHVQDTSGRWSSPRSFLFYNGGSPATPATQNYTCWFDENYASRTGGEIGSGHLLFDVSSLSDGFHTVNMQFGSGGAAFLRSWLFYKAPVSGETDMSHYTCWFDENYASRTGGEIGSGHLLFDVSSLSDGFHTVNMQFGGGGTASLRSWLFYKVPAGISERLPLTWHYSIDEVERQDIEMSPVNGLAYLNLDVFDLDSGQHVISYYITDTNNEVLEINSAPFYHPGLGIITFHDENGTLLQCDTLQYGELPAFRGVIPTKEATAQYTYTFAGWSPAVVPVAGNAAYTATYSSVVNKYVVMFLDEDSTLLQIDTLNYGAMPEYRGATPAKQATAQYTYTFNGWNNAIVSVTGDATYVATYVSTVNKYVVSFRDEDNTLLQRDTLEYGALPAYRGQTPTKAATAQHTYSFAGWNPSVASVIGDATYTATYDSVVNKYVVMFLNEDSTLLQIDTLNYGAMPEYRGATPTKQATAQYAYTFNGWNNAIVSVTGSATYLATYVSTTNKYLIIFQDEDGTPLQQDSVEYGALPAYRGTTPTKQSTAEYTYTFAGWNPSVASVISDATYTATYYSVVNKYVITFQNEDGTVLQRDTLNYGATPVYREANPTKESTAEATYTFAGWAPSITAVVEDAVYTATYDSVINTYVIMFLNEDSTLLQIDTLAYGAMPEYRGITPTKQATAQYTYTFNGWNNAIVSVTGNAAYLATYVSTTNKYLIIFQDEDGTPLQQDSVEYGALPAYRGTTPTKQSTAEYTYTFAGWNPSVASVIGNATYTATYNCVVNKYVVMFLNEDSTLLQIDTLAYGAMPEYRGATPTKQATAQYTYTFNGWNNAIVSVTGDVTYLATYVSTTNKYLIIFQDEDGTPLQQDSVGYGALPAYRGTTPTKQSTAEYTYTFAGWNPSVASVIGDATYTATYYSVVNKYVITFQNEDGTVLQRDTLNYGATPVYREANPTKESTAEATYTFAGWTPSITAVVEDVVYTATYDSVVNTYVVMFLNEDSTLLQIDTLEYGAMPEYRGEDPVKPNEGDYFYVFTGWEPDVVPVVGNAIYVATYESHGTGLDNVAEKQKPIKVMEDGKLYILMPDGTKYSATGKKVE